MKNLCIAISVIAVFFLTGCSDSGNKSGKRITTRGTRGAPTVNSDPDRGSFEIDDAEDQLPQGQDLYGKIYERAQYIRQFQNAVDDLVSSFMDPRYLEYNSNEFGLYNANIGVYFGASIEFEGFDYQPGMSLSSNDSIVESAADLRISIYDSLVGERFINEYDEEEIYTEIPMDFSDDRITAYEIIDSQRMAFVFEDVYGLVQFSSRNQGGFYNEGGQTYYWGEVYYANKTSYFDDEPDSQWQGLGFFVVPACNFFKCR